MNKMYPIKSQNDIEKIADELRKKSERNYILFMIGIYTGLRISDIIPLRVRDVKGTHIYIEKQQKTKKEFNLLIHEDLKQVLDKYIKGKKDYEYLFPSRKGSKHIKREQAYRILNEVIYEYDTKTKEKRKTEFYSELEDEVELIGCHTLRKTFGYHFYNSNNDIMTLKEIFGHSDISTTLRYIGMNQDKKDSAMQSFSFGKKASKR